MAKINKNYLNLGNNYLFREIEEKVQKFNIKNPNKKLINLGIGDVTLPICDQILKSAVESIKEMGKTETFKGYGPNLGYEFLREKIKENYFKSGINININEIFVSDGAKCDISNILDIFSKENTCLIPDPVYPVYSDTNIMIGNEIIYMDANEENNFLPKPNSKTADLIYICSPNNPTGAVYTKEMLQEWVDFANLNKSIIFFDAAYESFISCENLPHSIFEIPGSKTCAIEFKSFSKSAGFTGIRCGYTVVPKDLIIENVSLNKLWNRRHSTKFNGVSYITQKMAEAIFTEEGQIQCQKNINYYKENAKIIANSLKSVEMKFFGGYHAPYVWFKCPKNMYSWEFFDYLLKNLNIIGTPGSGFGKNGEKYMRFSSFGRREYVLEASEKIKNL
ncbi:MAG: LL-diaminopimelate aminotransferase [Oscillospiraceae bacterium]|jgi:LL-diaminopimelate aminotransferase|nr:LL-diaminopimelate aminotransferase [Oscillospiraceae bacterium]